MAYKTALKVEVNKIPAAKAAQRIANSRIFRGMHRIAKHGLGERVFKIKK